MTEREHLIQDLRAHAHEAPAVCRALMRRAANELERRRPPREQLAGKHNRPHSEPEAASCPR